MPPIEITTAPACPHCGDLGLTQRPSSGLEHQLIFVICTEPGCKAAIAAAALVRPAAPRLGTVDDYPDADLLRRAVISAHLNGKPAPRWVHVSERFALGSTYAAQLCVRFALDPNETVPAQRQLRPAAATEASR